MALFENLSSKLVQVGQGALQKTKDVTDVARFNSIISDEEKKINNCYYQIGKLYVSLHSNDYENDFSSMIEMIHESENKIQECRQQIQNIRGVRRCEKCGAEVSVSAAFCNSCGAEMPIVIAPDVEATIKCQSCGNNVKKGMRFCTSCGARMSAASDPVKKEESDNSARRKDAASHTEYTCPHCGNAVDEGLAFCTECGAKL